MWFKRRNNKMAEQNEIGCQALKQEIRKLESRVAELERGQKKDTGITRELIYLCNSNFLGSLTNERIIADLKKEIIMSLNSGRGTYLGKEYYFTFDYCCQLIQCGYAEAHIIHACYNLIKRYEKIEEQIKRYSGDKKE